MCASDLPADHLLQHTVRLRIIGGHGKRKFIPRNPLDNIAERPEKLPAASKELPFCWSSHIKLFIGRRRKFRQTSRFIQKRKEKPVPVRSPLHGLHRLNTDVDTVPILKKKEPGIGLIVMVLQAKAVAITKVVILFLL